jgi:ABC-2 type transport system ATP-binding protein
MAVEHRPLTAPAAPAQAASAGAALEADGVRRAYGDVLALRDLSLRIAGGEVLGLLGPNGAGKTTAIRVLTTILAPTAGRFTVAGIPHTRAVDIRRRIGVLPESAGLPESQTASEYLRYHARLFGHSRTGAAATATALLADVGLSDRAGSPIAHLSRGMRQRLGIARALVNDPAVVFLDEPTLGLDPAGQAHVLRLVRGIARERGAAVVLCTHVLAEVEEACTRVLILSRGRTIADGTVADVTRHVAGRRRGRVRVPADRREAALAALGDAPGVARAAPDERPDTVTVELEDVPGTPAVPPIRVDGAARALAEAGIPLLAFELEGSRLSDAFLALTEDATP